jgi:hypothetical protein
MAIASQGYRLNPAAPAGVEDRAVPGHRRSSVRPEQQLHRDAGRQNACLRINQSAVSSRALRGSSLKLVFDQPARVRSSHNRSPAKRPGCRSSRKPIRLSLTTISVAFGGRAAPITSFSSATVLEARSACPSDRGYTFGPPSALRAPRSMPACSIG